MKKFRIGYFADGPWSHLAFEKLIEDSSIEIAFIVPRSDTTDTTLLEYAKTYRLVVEEKFFSSGLPLIPYIYIWNVIRENTSMFPARAFFSEFLCAAKSYISYHYPIQS